MCILCIEIQKQNMNIREVVRAYSEIKVEDTHKEELFELIDDMFKMDEFLNEWADVIYQRSLK